MSGLKVTINSKGLVYSVILLLASVVLTVRAHADDQLSSSDFRSQKGETALPQEVMRASSSCLLRLCVSI